MYIKFLNRHISTTVIAIALTFIAFVFTVFFIIIFKVEDKTISIINFHEQAVKVTVKGAEYTIQPFDTTVLSINTNNTLDVSVTDLEGSNLQNIRISGLTRASQLVTMALSPDKGYCFFNTKIITDPSGNIVLDSKININTEPQNFAVSDMNTSFADYTYPGKVAEVAADRYTRSINYVYPISCNLIDNNESVLSTVAAFADYNPQDQLKYLQDIRAKIEKADNVDSLNLALPGIVNKYYISEENYILVYE